MTGKVVAFVLRAGVVVCVTAAIATALVKLPDAVGLFDLRADLNAASSYSHRTHTHREWSPAAGEVLETARLWMPEDARYRVVLGPRFDSTRSADFSHQLLYGFLLPRRPTRSERAEWLICYGCDRKTLGDRFELIAQVEGGPTFGRMRP
jgi:hypothetical protein